MSDPPRRSILKLKNPPARATPPKETSPQKEAAGDRWKCKPCGGVVTLTGDESSDAEIRCPACNARLGLAGDFRREDGGGKVRARPLSTLRPGA